MNLQSYLVLAVVLVLAAAAVWRMLRHRGCGSCGDCSSCGGCGPGGESSLGGDCTSGERPSGHKG